MRCQQPDEFVDGVNRDVIVDAGFDAGFDAGVDTGVDTGVDAGVDLANGPGLGQQLAGQERNTISRILTMPLGLGVGIAELLSKLDSAVLSKFRGPLEKTRPEQLLKQRLAII